MQPIENADVNATDDEIQVDYLEKTEEENSESSSENEDYPGEDVVEIVNLKGKQRLFISWLMEDTWIV